MWARSILRPLGMSDSSILLLAGTRRSRSQTFKGFISFGGDMASTLVTKPKVHAECTVALVLQSL